MLSYKGNKQQNADFIVSEFKHRFPNSNTFIDLFGGSGSVSYHASKYFDKVIYNDIQKDIQLTVESIFNGTYYTSLAINEFISREDFFKAKNSHETIRDGLIRSLFSYCGDLLTYAYHTEKEKLTECFHNIVVKHVIDEKDLDYIFSFDGFEKWMPEKMDILKDLNNLKTLESKRSYIKRFNKFRLVHIEKYNGVKNVKLNDDLKKIQYFNQDYRNIELVKDSVIYCDIPYKSKKSHFNGISFNYDEFFQWMKDNKDYNIFYSEYAENVSPDFPAAFEFSKNHSVAREYRELKREVFCCTEDTYNRINHLQIF